MRVSRTASRLLQIASRDPSAEPMSSRYFIHAARLVRSFVLRFYGDPACVVYVRGIGIPLCLPLSHRMPSYRAAHSRYDALPEALATFIRASTSSLQMIDVGANVGDTILSTSPKAGDRYLALEPHPDFFPYLQSNVRDVGDVLCLQVACGEVSGTLGFDPASGGTASPQTATPPLYQVPVQTLDEIWSQSWGHGVVNFLKVDTDGFDTVVLRGSVDLLRDQKPWILYECDVRLTANGLARHLDAIELLRNIGYRQIIVFDNLGLFVECIGVEDTDGWRRIFAAQAPSGPVYYHDLLAVPHDQEPTGFINSFLDLSKCATR